MKLCYEPAALAIAERYAHLFELELVPSDARNRLLLPPHEPAGLLIAAAGRLALSAGSGRAAVCVNPTQVSERASSRNELGRACGLNKHRDLHILDACAGWGIDGLALAAAGARVTQLERVPVTWALLDDLQRQQDWGQVHGELVDALDWLQAPGPAIDVVYLDPMFPPRTKRALPNQRLQLLQTLATGEIGLERWLPAALARARRRVVLKRRRKDPVLFQPTWQILGRLVRYDVYAAA